MDISLVAALVAGVVSFLSPCVLPLVPGYVSMLSGIGVEQLKRGEGPRGSILASSLAFVFGFSMVFIAFGASASAVGQFLVSNKNLLAPVAGAIVILFGLHLVGVLGKLTRRAGLLLGAVFVLAGVLAVAGVRIPMRASHYFSLAAIFLAGPLLGQWLNREARLSSVGGQPGIVGGFLLGFAFAFGWTPCIGPILAGVLALAATKETIGQGVFLLAVYSAGLAVPFLLTALGISHFLRFYQSFRRHLHAVEVGSGVLLLFVGVLIFTNRLGWLAGQFAFLNDLVIWLEKSLTGS